MEPGYYEYRDQSAPILKGAAKEQITLRLPENMKVGDIKWLSVWCRKFSVDFGNLIFPTDLNVRLNSISDFLIIFALLILPRCPRCSLTHLIAASKVTVH